MSEADTTLQRTTTSPRRLGGKRSERRLTSQASPIGSRSRRNERIAARLLEAADLLAGQRANPFRVAAYRRAAEAIARLDRDVGELFAERGRAGLEDALAIGPTLSAAIAQMIKRGRWGFLDRLRGSIDPAQIFQEIPGVGPALAQRFHRDLHLDTLEALEAATYDGRVEKLPGIGRRRLALLRSGLAAILGLVPRRGRAPAQEPPVEVLLDVDEEYRRQAEAGALPTIAPRRFNPSGESWLPILHTARGNWTFTALYSNTARAHELGRVHDWVVLYYRGDGDTEGQCTVVTDTRGPMRGRRVVRGREAECRRLHAGAVGASAKRRS